jgi:tetratricopeptide (TPR) repeat protein
MAKKKRPSGGKGQPRRRPPSRPPEGPASDLPDLPDRRAMERTMRDFVRSFQGSSDDETPLDRAQSLLYQAFEEPEDNRRIELARKALAICPDCADAYVLLAEHTPSRKEALVLWEQGVAAGERALGPKAFDEMAEHFWGVLETRPYMRARLGLAHALWMAGRRDEAVSHLQDMLRLNPNDNQGIRYTLAGFLLSLDRDDDLARLLEDYPEEGSAAWAYTRALLAFRRQGDTVESRRLLKAAQKVNKHVPAYLTGRKFPPEREPRGYSPGHESEAIEYISGFLAGWKSTPGAIAWMRANDASVKKSKKEMESARGPLSLVKKWLTDHLPQSDDIWQADFRPSNEWIEIGGQPARPWLILVANRSSDLILSHRITDEIPSSAVLFDLLAQGMQHPMAGEPHRPSKLQVRPNERWEDLRPHLDEIGIALSVVDNLDLIENIMEGMGEPFGGETGPGLLDMPGMKPEQVARFFVAAASFYRQAPWKKVGYEAAIRVECDRSTSGPWYAVLMGQSGLTFGLALYEDLDTLKRMWTGDFSNEENARQTVATTVTFGEAWETPIADVDAAQRYGWEVARPDAYPEVIHKELGLTCRPPLVWELELLEGCLRTVPEFVNRRRQDDPAKEEFTLPGDGRKMVLSWVLEK